MTRQQYELLENFGLRRIVPECMSIDDVEDLRRAIQAAVSIIPFASVLGMEYMSDETELAELRRQEKEIDEG